jgi:hypothetical protein
MYFEFRGLTYFGLIDIVLATLREGGAKKGIFQGVMLVDNLVRHSTLCRHVAVLRIRVICMRKPEARSYDICVVYLEPS